MNLPITNGDFQYFFVCFPDGRLSNARNIWSTSCHSGIQSPERSTCYPKDPLVEYRIYLWIGVSLIAGHGGWDDLGTIGIMWRSHWLDAGCRWSPHRRTWRKPKMATVGSSQPCLDAQVAEYSLTAWRKKQPNLRQMCRRASNRCLDNIEAFVAPKIRDIHHQRCI